MISEMIKEKLIKKFGEHILCNSSLWYSNGEKNLRNILKRLTLRNVLEIGTMYGLSAAVISEYCHHVYTYDIDDCLEKGEVWKFLKRDNIFFNSKSKVKYDLAFIDGEHWNGQIKKDFKKCEKIPYILFHDYNNVHKEVVKFIDGLDDKKKTKTGNFVLYKNSQLQKRETGI